MAACKSNGISGNNLLDQSSGNKYFWATSVADSSQTLARVSCGLGEPELAKLNGSMNASSRTSLAKDEERLRLLDACASVHHV